MLENYKNDYKKFEEFNKLVINMPRHEFQSINVELIKELAMILYNIRNDGAENLTLIKLYVYSHFIILDNTLNLESFILKLYNFELIEEEEIIKYYRKNDGKARDFRHLCMIMRLWGLLEGDEETGNKINYEACDEFLSINKDELSALRTKMMSMDIQDNPMFITLKFLKRRIQEETIFSYKPVTTIIKYMSIMNRAVSLFEVSNLLGVILPSYQSQEDILNNAIRIGKKMPENISEHKKWFFEFMNWKNDKEFFRYKPSQDPVFKFKTLILFMENLGLIELKDNDSLVISDYAKELMLEDIPLEILELEKYIDIAENKYSDKDLASLILYNIKPSLLNYAARNEQFILAMNKRSIKNPKRDKKGKKIRNKLITELAKVRTKYLCQIGGIEPFRDSKGNFYVEAHHIIEFNGEDGPDIIDNLLIINPYYHSLIHHGSISEVENLYDHIRKNNIINVELFKKMYDDYGCIEDKHIQSLLEKKLITKIEFASLIKYINK